MAVFSTNQARQLYVVKGFSSTAGIKNPGDTKLVTNTEGDSYFQYMGADGTLMRSDLLPKKNIISIKVTDAAKLGRKLKQCTVALDAAVNKGAPIAGQDYILNIAIRQYVGMSDEDIYYKFGAVHATAGMTAAQFYTALADSLTKNFSRELVKLLNFTATANGVVITEVEQEWTLGIKAQEPVYFEVIPTTVTVNGDEVIWGTTTYADTATVVGNGKNIADLEYFCMGERGDIYRNINWPNSIPTKYLVDPTQTYHVVDIHYYYVGANEGSQKSEKDITLVVPSSATVTSTAVAGWFASLATAAGITVQTVK